MRRGDGFAGLKVVPPEVQDPDEAFTVRIFVEHGRVSIEWDPKPPDVTRLLSDLVDTIGAAVHALHSDQNVEARVQRSFDMRVRWREQAEERQAEYDRTHPWQCVCGKRCKTETGLGTHRRSCRSPHPLG